MNSLRFRLALWFGLSFFGVALVLLAVTYHEMEVELRQKHWQTDYPNHPDWKLHGSFSEAEVDDVMGELLEAFVGFSIPLVLMAIGVGYYLARKSLRPIERLNEQLHGVTSKTLDKRIVLSEGDKEFRDLTEHINDLLARLNAAFIEMGDYAARVAHELRTPLSILRLKVEQGEIEPELSEELHEELHRLSHVVDQSLLIAKADQGRLVFQPQVFDLAEVLADVVKDFDLLAVEAGREIHFRSVRSCRMEADLKYFKQILHNLLTNSLKHGQGSIRIRLASNGNRGVLVIYNRVGRDPSPGDKTLGLGLRVVGALLGRQPQLRSRVRSGKNHYSTSIRFPCA